MPDPGLARLRSIRSFRVFVVLVALVLGVGLPATLAADGDGDGDGVPDAEDNCPTYPNADQSPTIIVTSPDDMSAATEFQVSDGPTGRRIVYLYTNPYFFTVKDLYNQRVTEPTGLKLTSLASGSPDIEAYEVSPDGAWVVYSQDSVGSSAVPTDASRSAQLVDSIGAAQITGNSAGIVSQDDTSVYFLSFDGPRGNLAEDDPGGQVSGLVLTPDRRTLVYHRFLEPDLTAAELHAVAVAPGGIDRTLYEPVDDYPYELSFDPTGTQLTFSIGPPGEKYSVPLAQGNPTSLTSDIVILDYNAEFTPDGQHIVYFDSQPDRLKLLTLGVSGSSVLCNHASPTFAVSNTHALCLSRGDLLLVPFDGGPTIGPINPLGVLAEQFDVTPDSSHVVFSSGPDLHTHVVATGHTTQVSFLDPGSELVPLSFGPFGDPNASDGGRWHITDSRVYYATTGAIELQCALLDGSNVTAISPADHDVRKAVIVEPDETVFYIADVPGDAASVEVVAFGMDLDGDGVLSTCDVCPAVFDDQSDADGDGVGDACDCAVFDASQSPPGEVLCVTVERVDVTTAHLHWPAVINASSYTVFRGNLEQLDATSLGSCAAGAIGETWFDDTETLPGTGSFFLIRADGCGPGSLGAGMGGAERVNDDPGVCP